MELRESVVICTRNRLDDLLLCLDSIATQSQPPQELIIVDSSDIQLQKNTYFIKHFSVQNFPKSRLKYIHTSPGLTYQRNVGIKQACGKILYFFDDDVVLEKDYLLQMDTAFQSHPEYAGGMGDITNINKDVSSKYQWFRRFFLLPREQASGDFTWSGMPTHAFGTARFKPVEVVGGCCMAFRKHTLQTQQFDESFKGYSYMEDADIARRISYSQPLFYNPTARLQHNESPIARDRLTMRAEMFAYNYSYLFFKNFFWRNPFKIIPYFWSLIGLYVQAVMCKNKEEIKGYTKGVLSYFTGKL